MIHFGPGNRTEFFTSPICNYFCLKHTSWGKSWIAFCLLVTLSSAHASVSTNWKLSVLAGWSASWYLKCSRWEQVYFFPCGLKSLLAQCINRLHWLERMNHCWFFHGMVSLLWWKGVEKQMGKTWIASAHLAPVLLNGSSTISLTSTIAGAVVLLQGSDQWPVWGSYGQVRPINMWVDWTGFPSFQPHTWSLVFCSSGRGEAGEHLIPV